jgi:hypothetical protein
MYTLFFSNNLTSTELAAWVQAIGTIAAILSAAIIAVYQSRRQHQSALALHKEEQRYTRIEQAKTLLTLCQNSLKVTKHFATEMRDRELVYLIATKEKYLDYGELQSLRDATSNIPLHSLPSNLITFAMVLGATIRQFKHNIDLTLQFYKNMDATQYEKFFNAIKEINSSLELTCEDIKKAVNQIKDA